MQLNGPPIYSLTLKNAINPHALTVAPHTSLVEVLHRMARVRSSCPVNGENGLPEVEENGESSQQERLKRASCVLVMEASQLVGIFTERDIVRLIAAGMDLKSVNVADVMSHPVVTLTQSDAQDIFSALSILRHHRIRHLPILSQQGQLIGMLTPGSIRASMQPANLLTRLWSVADVMTTQVIHAPSTASVLNLAQLMAEYRVSCVVITRMEEQRLNIENSLTLHSGVRTPYFLVPVGIVTEGDVVEFQALELNLSQLQAQDVMSTPLFCLGPDESLWVAHQEMQRRHVRRLVVAGNQGELLGIVSQTSLLQVLDPTEMYGVIEALQQAVDERTSELRQTNEQLQREITFRVKAEEELQKAHDDLKRQVEERTAELQAANALLKKDIVKRQQVEEALRKSEAQLREQANQLAFALHELQRTQAQLIQTEKMSSLGQLVAGVAHEINNPVSFIHGNLPYASQYVRDLLQLVYLYQQHYPQSIPAIQAQAEAIDLNFLLEDLPKLLASMQLGAERIRQIVLSLRNFSRLDQAEMKPVDLHEGIDSTLLILQNRLKVRAGHPGILVIKEYGDLPPVECYAGQMNQVFMNILSNAIDAVDESENLKRRQQIQQYVDEVEHRLGTIRIRTELLNAEWVAIRIADNGPGISETVLSKLFDPFYTTKPPGKGTGLGLSISYQIVVEKHGGQLKCFSTLGDGTEFAIEIPIRQKNK
ncbi:CBS domain-containing protein [Planktothrix sp. FACHB-1355]|uniref:histidine kinase n=1 Tax=Aerosakkonema funiforme FACHB-1375 TaxID=2949571 RepID=A0A926VGF1_9CYAN|nr:MULTISPECIES: CBS domain-containing protein [Oscillatoriales]MBD2183302.1 CBS domain-containing protein [Aerosakkonema funiforme FACHB-1375]MBD3560332.1 CBS domain-containing protein [Planktothrix sp. FACHB-1355]